MTARAATGRLTSPVTTPSTAPEPSAAGARAGVTAARRARRRRAGAWSPACRRGQVPAAYRSQVTPLRVWRAVPAGHRPARDLRAWTAAVREAALADFRADAADRRVCLAAILATHTDWGTCTARTGWALLADRGCVSRSTVARFLAWLRSRDLIGVVSTGRVGSLTRPMALTGPTSSPPVGSPAGSDGELGNEAAVYVLVEPRPVERPRVAPDPGLLVLDPRWATGQLGVDDHGRAVDLTHRGPVAVDEFTRDQLAQLRAGTHHPVQSAAGSWAVERTDTPKWSREAGTQNAREQVCSRCRRPTRWPLRGRNNATSWQHLPGLGQPTRPDQPTSVPSTPPPGYIDAHRAASPSQPTDHGPAASRCRCRKPWPSSAPATTGRDRLHLVEQLRATAPALTRVGSTRQLRHLLRPWLNANWTINDVLLALDQHPHTGARPHTPLTTLTTHTTGPGAIHNPPGWLLTRLRDWTHPDGTPLPNHAQRTATHRAARDLALTAARATTTLERAAAVTTPPPAWTTARTALHHSATTGRR